MSTISEVFYLKKCNFWKEVFYNIVLISYGGFDNEN